MTKQRTPIGRTLSSTLLDELETETQTFTLASGKTAIFVNTKIPAQNVENQTYVTFENNGRDQAALNELSLKDILNTIRLQQFYPAIGRRTADGIEILDGSRRRAAVIIAKVGLNVLVTDDALDVADARQLARDLQTAKEHNLREQGLRFIEMRESGMNQKAIAETERLSEAKVSRAIQAASVPAVMLELFPVQSELTYPDYKNLLGICTTLKTKNIELVDFVDLVLDKLASEPAVEELPSDDAKDLILSLFKASVDNILAKSPKEKVETKTMWNFADKDRIARKKIKGRSFSYEFSRLPSELQEELDKVISETLNKHFG